MKELNVFEPTVIVSALKGGAEITLFCPTIHPNSIDFFVLDD